MIFYREISEDRKYKKKSFSKNIYPRSLYQLQKLFFSLLMLQLSQAQSLVNKQGSLYVKNDPKTKLLFNTFFRDLQHMILRKFSFIFKVLKEKPFKLMICISFQGKQIDKHYNHYLGVSFLKKYFIKVCAKSNYRDVSMRDGHQYFKVLFLLKFIEKNKYFFIAALWRKIKEHFGII